MFRIKQLQLFIKNIYHSFFNGLSYFIILWLFGYRKGLCQYATYYTCIRVGISPQNIYIRTSCTSSSDLHENVD